MPYFDVIRKNVPVTPPVTVKSFSSATDAEITSMLTAVRNGGISYQDLVDAGWTVGAERTIQLSSMDNTYVGETHAAQNRTFVILHGKDFFDLADGGKNLFVVGLKNVMAYGGLPETGKMNSNYTNSGGWDQCQRRQWCNITFKNAIPLEELNWFKQFNVKTSIGSKSTSVITSTDWFSLPSRAEVFGGSNTAYTPDDEGITALDYYLDADHRLKHVGDSSSTATGYWLRSPRVNSATGFCMTTLSGSLSDYVASNSVGLSPFGCF